MTSLLKIAKKHLGQNFLVDPHVKERIIQTAAITSDETILEIGPGLGDLTEWLIKQGATVYAIEKDTSLILKLEERFPDKKFHLINADFLKTDLSALPTFDKIIGNIPYNISSPIIEKLVNQRSCCPNIFLTVQMEFAKRLNAQPNTKDYGSLTCFVQYYYETHIHFRIHPQSFRPVPKVTSSFIQLLLREYPMRAIDDKMLFYIIRTAFRQRRKTILNALSPIIEKKDLKGILQDLKIGGTQRAENILLDDYIKLANRLNDTVIFPSRKTNA